MFNQIPLDNSWRQRLEGFFNSDAGRKLDNNLDEAYDNGTCYPPREEIFNAFNACKFEDVKVVIMGQDPYHGAGEAHGLAFSVNTTELPPTLKNIYKAIKYDYPEAEFNGGNLTCLAKQGVLLLNSCLTVGAGKAMSHCKLGWQALIDKVIPLLVEKGNVVFILWGQHAHKHLSSYNRATNIKQLRSVHPSPLSAYQGFFSASHFRQCNDYLESKGLTPIDWSIYPM